MSRSGPPADPHAVLGVPPSASAAQITAAYRARLRALHPDTGGPAAEPALAEVLAAYRALRSAPREAAEAAGGPDAPRHAGHAPAARDCGPAGRDRGNPEQGAAAGPGDCVPSAAPRTVRVRVHRRLPTASAPEAPLRAGPVRVAPLPGAWRLG